MNDVGGDERFEEGIDNRVLWLVFRIGVFSIIRDSEFFFVDGGELGRLD